MSYQVLARKYRPATFEGLVGQDHVVRALTHALDHDRLHHAYLFTGTRGVGKTTIARVLAKCLNCEKGVSSTPCGECSICVEVNENRFVDLIEVDAASRTRVDDTRELLENAQYLPSRGRFKVYLVDEVHMLSASSFNALLKTLEEPPSHVKFLLATTDPKKVPVTVLSRCLQFQLKNMTPERTASYLATVLNQEEVPFDEAALAVIGRAARGSMRDALSIADQAIAFGQGELRHAALVEMLGLVGRDEIGALVAALASGEADRVLAVVAELADRAVDFETLLAELLSALHQMAVAHALNDAAEVPFGAEAVQLLYQIGLLGYRDLAIAPDPRSGLEMTLLRMLAFAPDEDSQRIPPLGDVRDSAPRPAPPEMAEVDSAGQKSTARSAGEAAPVADVPPEEPSAPRLVTDVAEPAAPAAARSRPVDQLPAAAQDVPSPGPTQGGEPDGVAATPAAVAHAEEWHELVGALDIAGVARMIAEHSLPAAMSAEAIELTLDRTHDTLLGAAQVSAIERALVEHLGRPLRLSVRPGELAAETPARRRARLAEERQQQAQSVLEADDVVRSLLSEFDGRLDEVRSVDGGGSG